MTVKWEHGGYESIRGRRRREVPRGEGDGQHSTMATVIVSVRRCVNVSSLQAGFLILKKLFHWRRERSYINLS